MVIQSYLIPIKPIRKTATKILVGTIIALFLTHMVIWLLNMLLDNNLYEPDSDTVWAFIGYFQQLAPKVVILGLDIAAFLFLLSFIMKPVIIQKESVKHLTYKPFKFWGCTIFLIGIFAFGFIETISLIGLLQGLNNAQISQQFWSILQPLLILGLGAIPFGLLLLFLSLLTDGHSYKIVGEDDSKE